MEIHINNLENYIDKTILQRGRQYHKNGCVGEIGISDNHKYTAEVYGTDTYEVTLKILDDKLQEYVCTCPYDMGPICKHIVAVLYEIRNEEVELEVEIIEEKPKNTRAKSVNKQVEEVFNKLSEKEKSEYLKQIILGDKKLRDRFLNTFATLNSSANSAEYFSKQIKSVLKSVAGRDGFIGWGETSKVWKELDSLYSLSDKMVQSKNFRTALNVNFSLLKELVVALGYCDDSNGDIGGMIDTASANLLDIAQEDLSIADRQYFLDFCINEYQKKTFHGWDWHMEMMLFASYLAIDEEHVKLIIDNLTKHHESNYEQKRAETIHLRLLERFRSADEAKIYKLSHRNNGDIRTLLIQECIDAHDLDKALEYAQEGYEEDIKDKPGLAKEWIDWQLKIAQLRGDRMEIIRLARYLFIDDWRKKQDYFAILKGQIPTSEWPEYLSTLIADIKKSKKWQATQMLISIYIREKDFKELLEIVRSDPSFNTLDANEKYLITDYKNELSNMYEKAIYKYMENNVSRSHYKTAVKYIRKIKKLDSIEKSLEIVAKLRRLYPQRRALMEELRGV